MNADPPHSDVSDPHLAANFTGLAEELDQVVDQEIRLLSHEGSDVFEFRLDRQQNRLIYPALSVPLGSEDELSCPDEQVAFLREQLQAFDGLNVLVIGYSGLDHEALGLLRDSGNQARSLFVVSDREENAELTVERLHVALGTADERTGQLRTRLPGFGGGFTGWAQALALDEYFDHLT